MPPHGHPGARGGKKEKPKNAMATLKRLIGRLRPSLPMLCLVFIFAVAGTLMNTFAPLVLGQATTEVYEASMRVAAGTGGLDFDVLGTILLVLLALYAGNSLCSFLSQFILARVTQDLIYGLRESMKEKMDKLPLSFFDGRPTGEVLSRVTNDVDLISSTLQETLVQIVTAVVTLVSVVIFMFSISWILTLVAFLTLPLSLLCTVGIASRSQRYFRAQQSALGTMNAHIEEMFTGNLVVKTFGRQDAAIEEFNQRNTAYYEQAWRAQFLSGVIRPLMGFIGNFGYVIACVLGAVLYINGMIATVGNIQAFLQYMRSFSQPITQIASIANTIQATLAAAERVFELLDQPEMIEPAASVLQKLPHPGKGAVEFDHVYFGYDPERTIIKDFNLKVEPGQMVAIVGPTGAGKTTLVNLLMRFYEIDRGAIYVDGVDTSCVTRHDLREDFGMVLQDSWLFKGTIQDNISYGKPDATLEEVRKAAALARADHFIQSLPEGYQTVVHEDGSNLSHGQRQLLTIARALLVNPSVLILDEATSSIDTHMELLVQQAMQESMRHCTSFVIAHRLSTIKKADVILVIKDGAIVEQGVHEDLLALEGYYAQLHNAQFADCIDEVENRT